MAEADEWRGRIPDSVAGWPRRRLEHAIAIATETGEAGAWRRLRNLSAALGCPDIARFAHTRAAEPEQPPLAAEHGASPGTAPAALTTEESAPVAPASRSRPRTKSAAKIVAPSRPPRARDGAASSPPAPSEPPPRFTASHSHCVRIRSAIPRARAAWFEKWAAARGLAVERSGDDFLLAASDRAASALADLRDHPEFEIVVEKA